MKHRYNCSGAVLLAGCGLLAHTGHAFVVPSSQSCSLNSKNSMCGSKQQHQRQQQQQQQRRRSNSEVAALSMSWSAQEKSEILSGLADWQERDLDGVGEAGIKILTESSPTAVLTRYYESLAAGDAQQMVLVAPSCIIESGCATTVEEALSSECVSRVYHPDVEQGPGGKAPHLALWHDEVSADVFSPSSVLEQQTASLPQKAVMEEVFLWLQRTMLGMVDDEEEMFVDLGRKLLTVHKYVVVNATTEAELARTFWQEATALVKHGVTAAAEKEKKDAEEAAEKAKMEEEAEGKASEQAKIEAEKAAAENAKIDAETKEEDIVEGDAEEEAEYSEVRVDNVVETTEETGKEVEQAAAAAEEEEEADEKEEAEATEKGVDEEEMEGEEVLKASGLGGGDNPKEDSVLMALPGFRFKDRATFEEFVKVKLAAPLKALSPLGDEGVELSADIYAGEDLKFPVIIMSPLLEKFEAPEGGYKFINGRGEEQDADEYIRVQELKLAEEANERMKQQEQNPLFGPRSPPSPLGDEDSS